ncbi:class I SAM-dependent methyltransferase [Cellulosimicrobium cellulans]|uniref:class I SAM-dependent methyltransferase n=1 Tax=Cellulosimicrobium cellulans TaxID=1710 RepID=UPI002407476C|nr:class I SAM-dependent methyltransferase [Cellulosimicrobium cellulans]MDF9878075.1 SAM-dependent methyltransferase [Cellulosimicrobium cellulans]
MSLDPRTSANPLVGRATSWLEAVNSRHPWNHNEHFHGWVVRRVPRGARVVLDVGCGAGVLLGRLRSRVGEVHGIDADAGMVARACARHCEDPAVTVRLLGFGGVRSPGDVRPADGAGPLGHPVGTDDGGTSGYDAVTMVAVLHHLDLDEALGRARCLLAPGGRLLVVGLARVASARDLAVDVASAFLNPLVGLVKHPRRARPGDAGPDAAGMPVREPQHSVDEIARTARARLPGVRVRRRLFFRYTLEWTAPR